MRCLQNIICRLACHGKRDICRKYTCWLRRRPFSFTLNFTAPGRSKLLRTFPSRRYRLRPARLQAPCAVGAGAPVARAGAAQHCRLAI